MLAHAALHSNLLSVCRLVMVTSLSNLTAHLSGNCALHTALKEPVELTIDSILMYLVVYGVYLRAFQWLIFML
jgi:hypothetical protein